MSADEMPCGCEGHADNASLCRYPALEKELAAERKRREEAEQQAAERLGECGERSTQEARLLERITTLEDLWHAEQQAHTAAVTRAEQAERERGAMSDAFHAMRGERDALQRHYDAAGPEHNLLALLDLYHEQAERAERERDEARAAVTWQNEQLQRFKGSLLRAEASLHVRTIEYDEMQRAQEAGAERIRELMAQVQRAEADNAALVNDHDALRATVALCAGHLRSGVNRFEVAAILRQVLDETKPKAVHPGAAMLERMRAADTALEVATEALGALSLPSGPASDQARAGARERLVAALRAYDALKSG